MIREDEEITDEKADQLIAGLEQGLQNEKTKREVQKTGVISDLFDRTILARLEKTFAESTSGYYSLRAEEFRSIISEYIPATLVENVYRAIDVNDVGRVNYSDFTNYLIASEAGSSFSAKTFIARLVLGQTQDEESPYLHKDAIDCLVYVRKPLQMLVSGGRDGQIALWDPETLEPIALIDHRDKNAVYQEELNKTMDTLMKAKISKQVTNHHQRIPSKMAITSLTPMLNWGMLCVGSADCCVTIYELSTQDLIGRMTKLEDIPTAIECFQLTHVVASNTDPGPIMAEGGTASSSSHPAEETTTYLAVGDARGFLHIVQFDNDFGSANEVGSKKKNQLIFARCVEEKRYGMRDVHSDWVTQLKHIPEVNALLSSSRDGSIAFIDAGKRELLKIFRGHCTGPSLGMHLHDATNPAGVNSNTNNAPYVSLQQHLANIATSPGAALSSQLSLASQSQAPSQGGHLQHNSYGNPAIGGVQDFAWSSFGKYVVSGAERVLLFWDPFTLEIMSRIDNLRSPLISIEVCDPANKIFCALSNKSVLVYHNINFELLQTVQDHTLYKPVNSLGAMTFAADRQTLYSAGHKVTAWSLEKSSEDSTTLDEEDLVSVCYNTLFNQVLLVKSLGTLKIYQAETGEIARQFSVRPIDPRTAQPRHLQRDKVTGVYLPMVLHACLDRNQTRLCVAGADLSVQFWSVHDGSHLVHVLPQLYSTSLAHIYSQFPKSIGTMLHGTITHTPKSTQESSSSKQAGQQALTLEQIQQQQAKHGKVLLLGTERGHVCVYVEQHAVIDEVPTAFLRLLDESDANNNGANGGVAAPSVGASAENVVQMGKRRYSHSQTHHATVGGAAPHPPGPSHPRQSMLHNAQSQRPPALSLTSSNPSAVSANAASATASSSAANSTMDAVLWMKILPQSALLLVAYLSGRLVLWDIEFNKRVQDVSTAHLGAILNGMKRKRGKPVGNSSFQVSSSSSSSAAPAGIAAASSPSKTSAPTATAGAPGTPSTSSPSKRNNNNAADLTSPSGAGFENLFRPTSSPGRQSSPSRDSNNNNNSSAGNSPIPPVPLTTGNSLHRSHHDRHPSSAANPPMTSGRKRHFTVSSNKHVARKLLPHSHSVDSQDPNADANHAKSVADSLDSGSVSSSQPSHRHHRQKGRRKGQRKGRHGSKHRKHNGGHRENDSDNEDDDEEESDRSSRSSGSSGSRSGSNSNSNSDDEGGFESDENSTDEKHRITHDSTSSQQTNVVDPQSNQPLDLQQQLYEQQQQRKLKQQNAAKRRHQEQNHALLIQSVNGLDFSGTLLLTENNAETMTLAQKRVVQMMQMQYQEQRQHNQKHQQLQRQLQEQRLLQANQQPLPPSSALLDEQADAQAVQNARYTNNKSSKSSRLLAQQQQQAVPRRRDSALITMQKHRAYLPLSAKMHLQLPVDLLPAAQDDGGDPAEDPQHHKRHNKLKVAHRSANQQDDKEHVDQDKPQPPSLQLMLPNAPAQPRPSSTLNHLQFSGNSEITVARRARHLTVTMDGQVTHRDAFNHSPKKVNPLMNSTAQSLAASADAESTEGQPSAAPGPAPHQVTWGTAEQDTKDKRHHHHPNAASSNSNGDAAASSASSTSSTLPASMQSNATIVVECVTLLPKARIMIGACSDRYLRFWDLDTYTVLCSCLYIDLPPHLSPPQPAPPMPGATTTNQKPVKVHLAPSQLPDEVIRLLQVSDSEDVLVGAYESGWVRVWSIQSYSLVTLRNLLQKHMQFQTLPMNMKTFGSSSSGTNNNAGNATTAKQEFGEGMALAIAPLALLQEWRAHECPILSMEYIWFNYSDASHSHNQDESASSPTKKAPVSASGPSMPGRAKRDKASDMGQDILEGYVLTAGLDQKVYLWAIHSAHVGKCVGVFGTYAWDINSELTWASTRIANQRLYRSTQSSNSHVHVPNHHGKRTNFSNNGSTSSTSTKPPPAVSAATLLEREERARALQFNARYITKESLTMVESPSSAFLRTFCAQTTPHNTKEIGEYLDVLTKKIQNRPPSYTQLDSQWKEISVTHPIVEPVVPKKADFHKVLRDVVGMVGI